MRPLIGKQEIVNAIRIKSIPFRYVFIDAPPFSLVSSSGIINHDMMGCQIELKNCGSGLKTSGKLKKRRKSAGPLLLGKEKIIKNIWPGLRRPSRLPDRQSGEAED
jgi:hypothetical protein